MRSGRRRRGVDAQARAGNFSFGRLMAFLTALGQDVRIKVKATRKMEVVVRNNVRKQVSGKAGKSKSSASGRITRSVIEDQGTQFEDMVAGGTNNPFTTFVEWAGRADEKAYANL